MAGQVWTAGPFRGWPSSAQEEKTFVAAAKAAAGPKKKEFLRSDLTLLLVALHDGASFEQLVEFLPGTEPATLISAYEYIDSLRRKSTAAWNKAVASPFKPLPTRAQALASLLLPVPVARITTGFAASEKAGHWAATRALADVERETAYAQEVEDDLVLDSHSPVRRLKIGAELFRPHSECLWSSPFYLPRRITDLSPVRVSRLLGEL